PAAFDADREPSKQAARRAFQAAYILQSAGELERSADAYERSIRLEPPAEAHTFHGWALSFLGRYDDAIEECKRAIEVDPSFGNPYNCKDCRRKGLPRSPACIPRSRRRIGLGSSAPIRGRCGPPRAARDGSTARRRPRTARVPPRSAGCRPPGT